MLAGSNTALPPAWRGGRCAIALPGVRLSDRWPGRLRAGQPRVPSPTRRAELLSSTRWVWLRLTVRTAGGDFTQIATTSEPVAAPSGQQVSRETWPPTRTSLQGGSHKFPCVDPAGGLSSILTDSSGRLLASAINTEGLLRSARASCGRCWMRAKSLLGLGARRQREVSGECPLRRPVLSDLMTDFWPPRQKPFGGTRPAAVRPHTACTLAVRPHTACTLRDVGRGAQGCQSIAPPIRQGTWDSNSHWARSFFHA